jgi:hypothetical protein
MSAYYTRWCKEHGEWEMDIDNPSECPKCIELGLTEVQQLGGVIDSLRKKLADWAEHEDLAPHEGCNCRFCGVIRRSHELINELANLKDAFTRLREDRNRLVRELDIAEER